jgi:hypothetical protein
MLPNAPVQRLKGGNSTSRLPSDRLVIHPRELNITFKPQQKDDRCNFKIQLQFIPTFD